MVTLYNKVSFVNMNVLNNMNEQRTTLHPFLIFVNTVIHCLFMLVHSALTNVNKHVILIMH